MGQNQSRGGRDGGRGRPSGGGKPASSGGGRSPSSGGRSPSGGGRSSGAGSGSRKPPPPRGTGGAGSRGRPGGGAVPPASRVAKVERPPIPKDVPPLARAAVREIQRVLPNKDRAQEVADALAVGSERLAVEDVDAALAYLRWARQEAGASISVREVLGIALYAAGLWSEARKELGAYRRMSERQDQNHLIADCLRALGRDEDQIPDLVEAMGDAPLEARAEGRIVWASHVADAGDPLAGMAVLTPLLRELDAGGKDLDDEVAARVWYVAGDLTARAGRDREAIRWFRRVVEAGDEWDAEERLEQLEA